MVENQLARLNEGGIVVFGSRGMYDARISDITAAAAVSRRTFYDHFRSMDEFRPFVISQVISDFIDHLVEVLPKKDPVPAFVEALLAHGRTEPDRTWVLVDSKEIDFEAYDKMLADVEGLTGLGGATLGGLFWILRQSLGKDIDAEDLMNTAILLRDAPRA